MSSDLYIGNLPHDATETQVREHFSQAGAVHSIKLVTDRKGRSRCFGFITVEDADKALMTLNQKEFLGRKLTIAHAIVETPYRPGRPRFRRHSSR
jgi:RNA recognition motif-containing protein